MKKPELTKEEEVAVGLVVAGALGLGAILGLIIGLLAKRETKKEARPCTK